MSLDRPETSRDSANGEKPSGKDPGYTPVPDPPGFVPLRFWFPGYMLALVLGVITFELLTIDVTLGGFMFYLAMFFALGVSAGCIFGYATSLGGFPKFVLALALFAGAASLLLTFTPIGFLIGVFIVLIFFGPLLVGMLLGSFLRLNLKGTGWDQEHFLPL